MNPQEIFDALAHNTGKFPLETMQAAIADPVAITPFLLEELERMASDPKALIAESDSYMRHIFAMYLLAQFRETRAFDPLVRICHLPHEDIEYLLGDVITEKLPNILASVCNGDTGPIKEIIENDSLDEFVRGAGLTALVVLVAEGALGREPVIDYLREFARKLPPESPMWNQLAFAADTLYPEELMPELRAALEAGWIDPMSVSMKDLERSLREGHETAMERMRQRNRYLNDAIKDLQWWACFREEAQRERNDEFFPRYDADYYDAPYLAPTTYFRDMPKIGRNDPCPCGSGKKYKKCCMPG